MASKRQELRASSCLGKKTFRSEADAQAEIDRYERARISLGGMHMYQCPFGAHLHIGHSKNRPTLRAMLEGFPLAVQEA